MCRLVVALSILGLASPAFGADPGIGVLRGSQVDGPSAPAYWVDSIPPSYAGPPAPLLISGSPLPPWKAEFGARYWHSSGTFKKDIFDTTGSVLVSRLTYDQLSADSAEGYFKISNADGIFIKGYAGIGGIGGGNLTDEDFPPITVPYSATTSDQKDGLLSYASVDLGYNFFHIKAATLGAFVGYHYYHETVNAYGCIQLAANPNICAPPFAIPNSTLAITQDNTWNSLRIGVTGEVMLTRTVKLTGDAAWLPYTSLTSADTHWLRLGSSIGDFAGPTPETGEGNGVQLEAILTYLVSNNLSIGMGARYWYMQVPNGLDHFEQSAVPVGAFAPQVAKFETTRYGMFAQLAYQFDCRAP
ncbi:MAG: hypothetical protein ACLPKB_25945 [Xanthobacteraceae bacterium]